MSKGSCPAKNRPRDVDVHAHILTEERNHPAAAERGAPRLAPKLFRHRRNSSAPRRRRQRLLKAFPRGRRGPGAPPAGTWRHHRRSRQVLSVCPKTSSMRSAQRWRRRSRGVQNDQLDQAGDRLVPTGFLAPFREPLPMKARSWQPTSLATTCSVARAARWHAIGSKHRAAESRRSEARAVMGDGCRVDAFISAPSQKRGGDGPVGSIT